MQGSERNNRRLGKAIFERPWIALLLLMGQVSVGWSVAPQQDSGPKVFFDRSTSISGYVAPLLPGHEATGDPTPALYRVFVETLLGTLELQGPTVPYSFGESVNRIEPPSPLPIYSKGFYRDKRTRIDQAIEAIQPTDTAAIVTDLFQNNNDVIALVRSLRTQVLERGLALAVIGARTAYIGAVDPADLGAARGKLIPYAGSLPIFCLVAGPSARVRMVRDEFVTRFRAVDPHGELLRTILFDPARGNSGSAAPTPVTPMELELTPRGLLRRTARLFPKDATDPKSTLYVMALDDHLAGSRAPSDFSVVSALPDIDLPFGVSADDVTWSVRWEKLDEAHGLFKPDDVPGTQRQQTAIETFNPSEHLMRANVRLKVDSLEQGAIYRITLSAALQPKQQEVPAEWARINLSGSDLERARDQTGVDGLHEAIAGRTPNLNTLLRDLAVLVSNGRGALPLGSVRLYLRRS